LNQKTSVLVLGASTKIKKIRGPDQPSGRKGARTARSWERVNYQGDRKERAKGGDRQRFGFDRRGEKRGEEQRGGSPESGL